MFKKLKLWIAQQMMTMYAIAVRRQDQSIDWDKPILSRISMDQIRIESYRRMSKKHHKWSARYCNLLFGDSDWYAPIEEES